MATLRHIGEKIFTVEDQELFAGISGDRNPMHMDPIAARRLITGHQVVHGIHIMLTAIEYLQNETAVYPSTIACSFNNPVSLGEKVVFTQATDPLGELTVEAIVKGLVCTRLTFWTTPADKPTGTGSKQVKTGSDEDICISTSSLPLNEAPEFHLGKRYALKANCTDLSIHFPKAHRYLGKQGLASTVALSYVVGMVCPGLHSVFSSLTIDLRTTTIGDDVLRFSVLKYDPRFRLFEIGFSGGVVGMVKAFLRPPPQIQPTVLELSDCVDRGEFKGTRSLIIGGSRGLGEVTAKLLAAGGGDVVITYATGIDDARAVKDEIDSAGLSRCQIQKLNLFADPFGSLDIDWNTLDAVYYFGTPRIFRKKVGVFDDETFLEFCAFYITKFHALCLFLEAANTNRKIRVYFPSTVYVEARPKGMAEYAMAKSAAEVLIQEINRTFKNLSVSVVRLPAMSTDQTSSIFKVLTSPSAVTLLPSIRALHA